MRVQPLIEIFDHTGSAEGEAVVAELRHHAEDALGHCLAVSGSRAESLLAELETVEISLVSDDAIAKVHERFLDDPTPTDVITFQHGEILVSLDTAARSAGEHGQPVSREALLYLVHGLLHLNGFNDTRPEWRSEMEEVQVRILETISPFPKGENPG